MNNPFSDITRERAGAELLAFSTRLANGLRMLGEVAGVEAETAPRDLVYEEDRLRLYRYRNDAGSCSGVPILIVYALVNRPWITDLEAGRSLVRGLLDRGLDVYLLDWGMPDRADRFLTLDDYINGYLDRCVDVIRDRHGLESIDLLGICQGGTFSLCYTALHQHKVRRLVTAVTPVDFHTRHDLLSHLVRHIDTDRFTDAFGNVPGEFLNAAFLMLRPQRLMLQKYLDIADLGDDRARAAFFMRMERWIFDSPAQAGEAWRQFIREFYQENRLVRGTLQIGTRPVDLQAITVPILNIHARDDHLVPPDASRALRGCVGSGAYTELEFPGGHIGIYVSGEARRTLPPAIADWLSSDVADSDTIHA